MDFTACIEAFLLGIGLSMDALAVSLALGTAEGKNFVWKKILLVSFLFGAFQAVMPMIGWFGGSLCGTVVRIYGKIIASLLLCWIGGKMLWDRNKEEHPASGFHQLLILAFATSIDALLVGVGYACLGHAARYVVPSVLIIGVTTFLISGGGCIVGRAFGNIFGSKCAILGGLVLIGLAVKIFLLG